MSVENVWFLMLLGMTFVPASALSRIGFIGGVSIAFGLLQNSC